MINIRWEGEGPKVAGFAYLWAKRVRGFDPRQHCARCLVGSYVKAVEPGMACGTVPVDLVDEPYLYLCGVATSRRWADNLHLALRPAPGGRAEARTYRGELVTVEGAEAVAIPDLAPGFRGLGLPFTTCRNFRFGVAWLDGLAPGAG